MNRAFELPAASATIGLAFLLLGCSSENPVMPFRGPMLYTDAGRSAAFGAGQGPDGGGSPIGVGAAGPFDPGLVYFPGYYESNKLGVFDTANFQWFRKALTPNAAYGGIRPTDGALLYWYTYSSTSNTFPILKLVADDESVTNPAKNDIDVTPTCPGNGVPYFNVMNIAPDTGDILVPCLPCESNVCNHAWASGAPAPSLSDSDHIAAIGYGGVLLLASPQFTLLHPDGSTVRVQCDIDSVVTDAYRATPNGFWLLKEDFVAKHFERWHLAYDGSISEKALYPPIPDSVGYDNLSEFKIDGQGRVVALAYVGTLPVGSSSVRRSVIVRLDPDAASGEILFDGAVQPSMNQDDVSALYTGP